MRGVRRPRPGARPSSRPPSSSAPSTWGPGRPATWGNSSARGPWRSAPGWPWLRRAPRQARGADLPLSRPRGSNFLPGPSASRFCLLRPAGSGAGRPQGALALPKSGSGRRLPAPGPRGGGWLWVRAEGARCAGTRSGCVPYEKQNIFYTLKKKKKMFLPVAWFSPGLFLKPCLWVGAPGPAGRRRSAAGYTPLHPAPESGTWALAPSRGPEVGVWTPNLGSRPSAGCSYIPRPWPAALERGLLEGLRDAGWEGSFPCDPEAHRLSSFARKIGRASSEGPRCGLNGAPRLDLFKNHIEMLRSGLRC